MIQLSAELLALSGEPALLVRGGKILFSNDAAVSLLGPEMVGKSFDALFGKDVAGMQASSFVGETDVAGRRVLLRVKAMEGVRVVFLSLCTPTSELIGDAFLFALRSELMQLGLCASVLRSRLASADEAGLSAMRGISQSLYRADRTLQNLSVIRGVENGSLFFCPQPLDLVSLLRDLIDSVRLHCQKPEIVFRAPGDIPTRGDPKLLELLLLNLLSNCLRHAEGCTRIRIHLHCSGEQIILSVDDDGAGIPGDRLHTVLERFRCSGELNSLNHGPGLGLTAVRSIARVHGGTLLLESRKGVGTAVRVSLSRSPRGFTSMQSPTSDYEKSYDTILSGLADCLPPEAFDAPDRR